MFRYGRYVINTNPDYEKAIENGDDIAEIWCEVYAETDTEFKHCRSEFNMMPCFEYAENTVSEIENGIKNIIDNDSSYLELQIKSKKFERQSELFWRAVEYIKQSIGGSDIETTLSEALGMTDEEVAEALGESEVQQDNMIMS